MRNVKLQKMEKTAEGFKNETTRQLTLKVLACLRNLEACM